MTRMTHLTALILAVGLVGLPLAAAAQTPIPVKLDINDRDKPSKAFADALTAAITGDDRFQVTDKLPPNGMMLTMSDSLMLNNDDSRHLGQYDVDLKLGNGKYIDTKEGLCDLGKMEMCGRVVAQDAYDAYTAYMAKHPN